MTQTKQIDIYLALCAIGRNYECGSRNNLCCYRSVNNTLHIILSNNYSGFRRKARVIKCKGVMVPGVPCVEHGNWGPETRHCSLFVMERGVLRRKFWWESRLIRSSRIQRCRSFSERIGPRIILLESQPGKQRSSSKRSREITTEPIAVWVQTTKTLTK